MNWSYNCVKLVCDGKKSHVCGRIFRYANPDKRKLLEEREIVNGTYGNAKEDN